MRPVQVQSPYSSGNIVALACRVLNVAAAVLIAAPTQATAQSTAAVAAAPRRITTSNDTVFFVPDSPDEQGDKSRRALAYAAGTRSWFEARLPTDRIEARRSMPEAVAGFGASVIVSSPDQRDTWLGLAMKPRQAQSGSAPRSGRLLYVAADGRVQAMERPQFVDHDVSALAFVGDALWVGTGRSSANESGTSGVLRFKRSDSSWTQFTSRSAPLPGNDIADLHAFDEQVAIVTDSGAAVFDPRTGAWQTRYFAQLARNDSLVWVMSIARPSPDSVLIAARRLATLLGDPQLSRWTVAAQSVDRDSLFGVVRIADPNPTELKRRATSALANVAFLPFLTRALGGEDIAPRQLASDAIVRIKDQRAREVIRELMDTASIERALGVVAPLAMRHDDLALRWLHSKLADPTVRADTILRSIGGSAPMSRLDTLISTIVHVADESFVTQLLTLIDAPPARRILLGVMQLGPVAYQRQLVTLVGTRPRLWSPYFELFISRDSTDAASPGAPFGEDREIRRALVTFARVAVTRGDSTLAVDGVSTDTARASLRTNAIGVLAEWGGAPALPFLIEQLDRPQLDALVLVQAIVRVAGVDGGPVFKRADATLAQRLALKKYWSRWWETKKDTFTPVTRVASESAVSAWRQRAGVK